MRAHCTCNIILLVLMLLCCCSIDAPVCGGPTSITVTEDVSFPESGDVEMEATDLESIFLAFKTVQEPSRGSVTMTGGNLVYIPNPNENGADSFSWQAEDSEG